MMNSNATFDLGPDAGDGKKSANIQSKTKKGKIIPM